MSAGCDLLENGFEPGAVEATYRAVIREKNAEIERLRAALKPFADVVLGDDVSDRAYANCITVEMCRRAKRALSPG